MQQHGIALETEQTARDTERRAATRLRALKGAHIRFNKGYGAYEAVVRDMGEAGARLRFGDVIELPTLFEIRIGADGEYRSARVQWRRGLETGIRFL